MTYRFPALLATAIVVSLSAGTNGLAADNQFAIHDGDVVVFFGDSITENQLYTNFVETYVVTRYPTMRVRFVNAGWSGDTVLGGSGGSVDDRLLRDVISQNPTMVVVMLGMNDVLFGNPPDPATYSAGLQHIVDFLRARVSGVGITIMRPTPYDDVTRQPVAGGTSAMLEKFGEMAAEVAADNGLITADPYAPLAAALLRGNAADPTLAAGILPDRIHPAAGGALLVAGALLKAWNAAPLVSRAEIDGSQSALLGSTNAFISDLGASLGPPVAGEPLTLSWTQVDGSLPIPLDPTDAVLGLCLRVSDLLQILDQQTIRIANLRPGQYLLRIDDQDIGTFSADDLARTIDLAGIQTPMAAQALRTHFYTFQHNQLHYVKWRQIQLPFLFDDLPSYDAALGSVDSMEKEILALQGAAAVAAPHRITIVGPNTPGATRAIKSKH